METEVATWLAEPGEETVKSKDGKEAACTETITLSKVKEVSSVSNRTFWASPVLAGFSSVHNPCARTEDEPSDSKQKEKRIAPVTNPTKNLRVRWLGLAVIALHPRIWLFYCSHGKQCLLMPILYSLAERYSETRNSTLTVA